MAVCCVGVVLSHSAHSTVDSMTPPPPAMISLNDWGGGGGCWWLSRLALEVKQRAEGTTPPVCHLMFFSLHPLPPMERQSGQNSVSKPDPRSSRYLILDTHPQFSIHDSRYTILDPRSSIHDSRSSHTHKRTHIIHVHTHIMRTHTTHTHTHTHTQCISHVILSECMQNLNQKCSVSIRSLNASR